MRRLAIVTAVGLAWGLLPQATTTAHAAPDTDLARYVNTLIGPSTSSTIAGPTLPNGSIHPSPETRPSKNGGYTSGNPVVGFGQLYAQGTGGTQSYGNFLLSPQTGGVERTEANHASAIVDETGTADSYTATLSKYGIKAEVTPTANAAHYRFTYPAASDSSLVLDVSRKIGGNVALKSGGSVTIDEANHLITGGGRFGDNWNPAQYDLYFALEYDKTPSEVGTWDANGTNAGTTTQTATNSRLGAYLRFATTASESVNVRIAVSFVSVDQAKQFLHEQLPAWDFDATRSAAAAAWNSVLDDVELGGSLTEAQKTTFYTAMFHTNVQPRDRVSDSGYWDDYYTLWDSWKTVFPFLSLTRPDVVGENINSFIRRYQDHGYIAETFTSGKEFLSGQGGNEAENVIADAYLKNVPGVNWEDAYAAAKGDSQALRSSQYVTSGYQYSGNTALNGLTYASSRFKPASATMGFAINDHALSVMASGLGKTDDAAAFSARAQNWKNVWDASLTADGFSGFAHNRNQNGTFPTTTATSGYNTDFYEASIWEGSYYPVFDVPGMVDLMGGKYTFAARLSNALANGYIDFGNEPSFQTLWLFSTPEVKRPDLTSRWVDQYLKRFPANGYPGDEDNGAMSSIYMFMMSGLFPFSGTNTYYLHGARLPEVTYHLADGKDFVIKGINASSENIYVQSATLNGHPLHDSWITYDQIMAGGELDFVMGPQPSDWGREPVDPSLRPTDVTNLRADAGAATGGSATLTWDAATDEVGLFGYRVYRGLDEDFVPSAANLVGTTTATTFTEKPGYGTYFYKVVAVNLVDNVSANAAHTHVVTKPGGQLPSKYIGSLMFGASGRVSAQAAVAEGAAQAFDTDESTKWSARVTNGTQDMSETATYPLGSLWLEVDLGAPSEVTRWFLRPETISSTSAYKLPEFSLQVKQGDAWVDVSHVTGFQGPEHDETLATPVHGQVFRLLIPLQSTTDANYNARIQEFHLFGTRQQVTYPITVAAPRGGNATVATDKTSAAPGETVTVDVTGVDSGMAVRSLDVTHADGATAVTRVTQGVPQGTRRYSFVMEPLRTTVTATVDTDPGNPSDVTGLAADPAWSAMGRVRLTWDAASHPAGIQKYLVYRGLSEGFSVDAGSLAGESTDTGFTDAPGFGLFFYKVVAVSNDGGESDIPAVTWTRTVLDPAAEYGSSGENLALGRAASANDYAAPVSAPTEYDLPMYTLDGRVTTKWSARETGKLDANGNYWLKVDLGEDYVLNRWTVQHAEAGGESATYNTSDFALQALVDGSWVDIDAVTGNTAGTTDRQVMPFVARTVRILITKPVQPSVTSSISARIYEFALFSPAKTSGRYDGSLTVGKTGAVNNAVNTSTENWPSAFDMNSATKWSCRVINNMPDMSEAATYPYGTLWLSVDLGATYVVNRWLMENESPSANPLFLLQVKDGSGAWVEVDRVANSAAAPSIDKALPKPVAGRYFRVVMPVPDSTGNQNLNNARVREFHLFGPAGTAVSPVTLDAPSGWNDVVTASATTAALGDEVIVDIDTTAIPEDQVLDSVSVAHRNGEVAVVEQAGAGVPDGVRRFTFAMPPQAVTITVTAAPKPFVSGDPTALKALVAAADVVSGTLGGFTDVSAKAFTAALADAKHELAAATERTQAQLDTAASALQAAMAGLRVKPATPVDKAVLQSVYASAVKLSNVDATYTAASWKVLQSELTRARSVLQASSATQAQVDTAVRSLTSAIAGLTVAPPAPVKVKLNQSQLRLVKGKTFVLEEGVYYKRAHTSYAGAVTWKSSNTRIATVSSNGTVKAKKSGTVTITATTVSPSASGKRLSASIKVTVVAKKPKAKVTKVTASVPRTMKLGQSVYITGKYSSSKATGVKVTYRTSRSSVATVDPVGRILAKGKGTVTITVKAGGRTKTYTVTVK